MDVMYSEMVCEQSSHLAFTDQSHRVCIEADALWRQGPGQGMLQPRTRRWEGDDCICSRRIMAVLLEPEDASTLGFRIMSDSFLSSSRRAGAAECDCDIGKLAGCGAQVTVSMTGDRAAAVRRRRCLEGWERKHTSLIHHSVARCIAISMQLAVKMKRYSGPCKWHSCPDFTVISDLLLCSLYAHCSTGKRRIRVSMRVSTGKLPSAQIWGMKSMSG